jgi:NRPS condensation-like uncharacterized protein
VSGELSKLRSTGNRARGFIRRLGCSEHFFHLYAQLYPVHFCLCAEIEGMVDSDALHSALDRVRKRHPLLRVRIVDDEEFGTAFYKCDRPIAFETITVAKDADWRPTVECELKKCVDDEGPLLRATALCAPDMTVLVLTFCHAIADGMSGIWVLRDVLRALAGEQLKAFQAFPSIEEKILGSSPDPLNIFRPVHASRLDRAIPISPKTPSAASIVSDHLQTNIFTTEFSREETARLLERCRANDTTVNGAVCAAASPHVPASAPGTVRMVCPIDLRNMAGIENGVCGVFVGASSVEVPAGGATSIWHNARHIVRCINQSRSPEDMIDFLSRMSVEFPPTARSEKLKTFFSAKPQSSLVVSNLGVLPIAEQYGPYTVKAVWGPAMLTNLPEDRQTIGVSTFGGRLRIVHQSYLPIRGLVTAIRNSLLTACS